MPLLNKIVKILTFTIGLGFNILLSQNFVSDVSKVGTTAGAILDMPVSARGLAMGNAVSGLGYYASVLYWNPAGAARIRSISATATYIPWLVDTRLQNFSLIIPLQQKFVFGAYITAWNMDDMPVRTEDRQHGTGEYFNAGDLVASISLARPLTDRFSIGFSAKYIQERIWHSVARGAALDFGTMFRTDAFNGLTIIAVLTNYGTDMRMMGRDQDIVYDPDPDAEGNNGTIPAKYTTDWWALPLNFRFGLATELIQSDFLTLAMEVDALHPSNNYESVDIGVEATLLKTLFIRGGFSSLLQKDSIEGFSLGGGVKIPLGKGSLLIDYGYRDFGHLGFLQAITANFTL